MAQHEDGGIISSDSARRNWRDVMDRVQGGESLVIKRATKPVAVIIPFEDWKTVKDQLENLDDARSFREKLEAYRRNPTGDPVWDRAVAEEYGAELLPEQAERQVA